MSSTPTVLDSDFRYIDKKGNLMKTRTELSIAQMLTFLNQEYEYEFEIKDGLTVDFKTKQGLIEVIDDEEDISKYKTLKEKFPEEKIMAIGHPKFAARLKELEEIVFYDIKDPQTGSIFIEDPSFAFDYAHILPLVEKCSLLHGHTSSVMVELVGQMEHNMLLDFGEAKKIVKDVISVIDHKFFINKKYVIKEDQSHYNISFDGPKGKFNLQMPKNTTYLLGGEATVENLSTEIVRMLSQKLPKNVEAIGVYIYEGFNKGAHIISNISKS